jgi:hypothetical protein
MKRHRRSRWRQYSDAIQEYSAEYSCIAYTRIDHLQQDAVARVIAQPEHLREYDRIKSQLIVIRKDSVSFSYGMNAS